MIKTIESIAELNLNRSINSGSCGVIYEFDEGIYFKLLNEEYRSLLELENLEVLETLEELSRVTNTPSIAVSKDIYCGENKLFGFTQKKMPGVELDLLPESTRIKTLTDSLTLIKPEIMELSHHHIKTEDIGGDNILFSDRMNLIDLELSLVARKADKDYLYSRTMYNLFIGLVLSIYGTNITRELKDEKLRKMNYQLKNGESDDFESYFLLANDLIENMVDKKIDTLAESKHVFLKK